MSEFEKQLNKTAKQLIKKADNRQKRGQIKITYNAGIISIYGCQVAVPVILCLFLGRLLDHLYPTEQISWTLNLIIIGFILGFINANIWLKKSYQVKKGSKNGKL